MGINCYILNQDQYSTGLLSDYVKKTPGLKLMGSCADVFKLRPKIREENNAVAVLFLDGEMLSNHSTEMDALIQSYTFIVITSAHKEFSAEAFELNAVDYLQSPASYERFLKCINKLRERSDQVNPLILQPDLPYFFVRSDGKGKLTRINKADIVFVESALNYLRIHLDKTVHSTYLTISEMEEKLSERQFIRVHKSFIINMDKINSIEGNMIHLDNCKTIVVGPNYRKEFFERIGQVLLTSKRQA